MHMSNESLLVILFVGLVAGWLAGQIVWGSGFGLIGDLIMGIIGAFIGDWLLPRIGIHLGALFRRSSTPPSAPSYFCLWCGFCEVAAALGAAGADADGGSGRGKKRKPRAVEWRGLLATQPNRASARYARESSDNPILNAFWRVAPSVRFRVLAIFPAGVFFRASDFSSRTCTDVQARLFDPFFIRICSPVNKGRALVAGNQTKEKPRTYAARLRGPA